MTKLSFDDWAEPQAGARIEVDLAAGTINGLALSGPLASIQAIGKPLWSALQADSYDYRTLGISVAGAGDPVRIARVTAYLRPIVHVRKPDWRACALYVRTAAGAAWVAVPGGMDEAAVTRLLGTPVRRHGNPAHGTVLTFAFAGAEVELDQGAGNDFWAAKITPA